MADQYHHGNLKSKLLEEAVTLISQDGLENLSLRRLATQCGVRSTPAVPMSCRS